MKKLLLAISLIASFASHAVVDAGASSLVGCNKPNSDATLTVYVNPQSSSSGFYYLTAPDDSTLTGSYTFVYPITKRTFRVKNTTSNSFVVITDYQTLTPVVIRCS